MTLLVVLKEFISTTVFIVQTSLKLYIMIDCLIQRCEIGHSFLLPLVFKPKMQRIVIKPNASCTRKASLFIKAVRELCLVLEHLLYSVQYIVLVPTTSW